MYETGRRIVDPGAEGREDGELVFRGGQFQFGKMENFWKSKVVMIAQYECT